MQEISSVSISFYNKNKNNLFKKQKTSWTGFEPARVKPNRFLVYLLNHSDIKTYNKNKNKMNYQEKNRFFKKNLSKQNKMINININLLFTMFKWFISNNY